jgi:hypothetical protein
MIDQAQAVTPVGGADVHRAEAVLLAARHQASFRPLAYTHTTVPTG